MKDYKKILEGVVNIINTTEKSDIGFANICTYIGENCPELKESNDERIRKSILNYLTKMWGNSQDDVRYAMEIVNKYLERQAKRNPADKAESKFKVGDWVIDKQGIVHQVANVVENVTNHTYGYDIVGGGYFNDTVEGVRLWNISDAKEGDILVDSLGNVCIYQEPSTKLMYHSHCYGNHKFFIPMGGSHEIVGSYPATKEQRDQLEKSMADAGYVFDFEKKELKKIEHKPTWSEEDESNFQMLINVIKKNKHYATDYEHIKYYKFLSWFKSLKERVLPRQKQEWSEDDRARLQRVINFLIRNRKGDTDTIYQQEQDIDWLKAIKDRYVWKPSDEQMKALDWALSLAKNCGEECAFDLRTLQEQLKKLKG